MKHWTLCFWCCSIENTRVKLLCSDIVSEFHLVRTRKIFALISWYFWRKIFFIFKSFPWVSCLFKTLKGCVKTVKLNTDVTVSINIIKSCHVSIERRWTNKLKDSTLEENRFLSENLKGNSLICAACSPASISRVIEKQNKHAGDVKVQRFMFQNLNSP